MGLWETGLGKPTVFAVSLGPVFQGAAPSIPQPAEGKVVPAGSLIDGIMPLLSVPLPGVQGAV